MINYAKQWVLLYNHIYLCKSQHCNFVRFATSLRYEQSIRFVIRSYKLKNNVKRKNGFFIDEKSINPN